MEVVYVNLVFDGVPAEVIGRPVGETALDTCAGEPHGETKRMMLAAVGALRRRRAAKLAAPHNNGVLQQTAQLQVREQAGDGQIGGGAVGRQFRL